MPETAEQVVIKIKRTRLYPARPGGRIPALWTYQYSTPVDVDWKNSDGSTRPGPRAGEYISYGTGLPGLRDMLRRKHGRAVRIVETWKVAA